MYKNGEYYIGQWKNNLRHGEGILYYANGEIKQKGNWKEGNYIGN